MIADLSFAFLFFFQAEDGIRDYKVTGVQTCALPIWLPVERLQQQHELVRLPLPRASDVPAPVAGVRSRFALRLIRTPFLCMPDTSCKIGRASCRERV